MPDAVESERGTRSKCRKLGHARTAGIVLGVVVVFGVLCGVPLVALVRANAALARSVHTAKHMETLVRAIRGYMADNADCLPPPATWDTAIARYVTSEQSQSLASSGKLVYSPPEPTGADGVPKAERVPMPATWIILREKEAHFGGRVAVAFLDGKAQVLSSQEIAALVPRRIGD